MNKPKGSILAPVVEDKVEETEQSVQKTQHSGVAAKMPKEPPLKTIEVAGQETFDKDEGYNLQVIKDFHGQVDPFYLPNKDPNYEYRFIYISETNLYKKTGNVLLEGGGWQICPKEHCLKIGVPKERISPDGTFRINDVVLARIPRELYEEKMIDKAKRAASPIQGVNELYDGTPREKGADVHQFQTAEQLKMK